MQKQTVLHVVESMPENVDVVQLLNKLYVLEKIEAGERALTKRVGIPHEDVGQRYGR